MRIVVKVGGSLRDESLHVLRMAVSWAEQARHTLIIVHGGGPEITASLRRVGVSLPFENGIRQTTIEAMPIVEEALLRMNQAICQAIETVAPAASVSADTGVIVAKSTSPLRTGEVDIINPLGIEEAICAQLIPVIAPLGIDRDGNHYNINADTAAASVAVACGADKLIFFTDVDGVYRDFDAGELVYDTNLAQLAHLQATGALASGMMPKVESMRVAAEGGVDRVYVVNGRDEQSVHWSLSEDLPWQAERRHFGTRLLIGEETFQ